MGHIGCIARKHNFIAKPLRKDKTSSDLKLDGAYIGIYAHPILGHKEIAAFFLYENGIALFYEPIKFVEDSSKNSDWLKKRVFDRIQFQDNFFKRKQAGGYMIKNSKLIVQIFRYMPSGQHSLCTYAGKVLNNKTIYIEKCEMPDKSVYCRENFYLNHLEMEKPNSTNKLMKKSWYWK